MFERHIIAQRVDDLLDLAIIGSITLHTTVMPPGLEALDVKEASRESNEDGEKEWWSLELGGELVRSWPFSALMMFVSLTLLTTISTIP